LSAQLPRTSAPVRSNKRETYHTQTHDKNNTTQTRTRTHTHTRTRTYTHIYTQTYTLIHAHTRTYTHTHTHIYIYIYIFEYIYSLTLSEQRPWTSEPTRSVVKRAWGTRQRKLKTLLLRAHTHERTRTHTHMYIRIYTHVYIYKYLNVYSPTWSASPPRTSEPARSAVKMDWVNTHIHTHRG